MNLITKIQEKLESYKIVNPLEYIRIIKIYTNYTIRKMRDFTIYFNNDICFSIYFDPNNPNCIKSIFVSMSLNSPDNTENNFNYLSGITINNDNDLRILNDEIDDTLVLYKSIYDAYTKNKKAKTSIDFLNSIDILIIDHKNKCICIRR